MVVKVLIRRKIKEGKTREVFALLNKFRSDAMNQKGYISGETLFNHDDPQEILVISMWQSMENWLKWRENSERIANERLIEQWLEAPTEYQTYVLGTYYAQFSK
jgi:heme-degrading monooxygenase HmoA